MAEYTCQKTNKLCFVVFEFINWAMFLAVWIALAENISCNTSYCRVTYQGPRSFIKPCQTIYAAFAFAIFAWLLYCWSFGAAVYALFTKEEARPEKEAPGNA